MPDSIIWRAGTPHTAGLTEEELAWQAEQLPARARAPGRVPFGGCYQK